MSRYRGGALSTLYVRNISDRVKYDDMRRLFQKYGRVVDVTIPLDYYSGLPKGYCFVEYEDPRDAEEAQYRMDRQRLFGREIEVEFARGDRKTPGEMRNRDRDHREPRRGYGGRGGYGSQGGRGMEYDSRRSRSRSRGRGDERRGGRGGGSPAGREERRGRGDTNRSASRSRSKSRSYSKNRTPSPRTNNSNHYGKSEPQSNQMANLAKKVGVGESADYRKIDVDAYDEDRFVEEEAGDNSAASELSAREGEVRGLINKGNGKDAVIKALENPPISSKDQELKNKNLQIVMDALNSVKSADVGAVVKALNESQVDILMKYIYRGMSFPEKFNSGNLLAWHASAFEAGGHGSIVRVLTDRKTV